MHCPLNKAVLSNPASCAISVTAIFATLTLLAMPFIALVPAVTLGPSGLNASFSTRHDSSTWHHQILVDCEETQFKRCQESFTLVFGHASFTKHGQIRGIVNTKQHRGCLTNPAADHSRQLLIWLMRLSCSLHYERYHKSGAAVIYTLYGKAAWWHLNSAVLHNATPASHGYSMASGCFKHLLAASQK